MSAGFTAAQKQIVLERDNHQCPMCLRRATEVNHRANRGSGGFRGANTLSNACAICWVCNGLIESDPVMQTKAILRGVKLSRYDDPLLMPYQHPMYGLVLLDDAGGFRLDSTGVDESVDKSPPAESH